MWESCLFCLGGVKFVFERGRIWKLFDVSNLGGELEFTFVFNILFHIIVYMSFFPHMQWCVCWVVQERQVHSDQDRLPLIGNFLVRSLRLGFCDVFGHFYCIWALCCVFCHGLPKGEIVRFWVCNVGKPWQNMTKTNSH